MGEWKGRKKGGFRSYCMIEISTGTMPKISVLASMLYYYFFFIMKNVH